MTHHSISPRIGRLRAITLKGEENFRYRVGTRGFLTGESYRESVGRPWIVRKAQALASVILHWPVEI